jgi:uncharacterized membrane protein
MVVVRMKEKMWSLMVLFLMVNLIATRMRYTHKNRMTINKINETLK